MIDLSSLDTPEEQALTAGAVLTALWSGARSAGPRWS